MSENRFTEVTHQSWFSRIGGAIKGIFIGLILVIVSFPLLFLNEGRAVKREKSLKEGAGAVVSINSDQVDAGNNGKLVHLNGKAETEAILSDTDFGVSGNALKLRRIVEMYQWKESKSSSTDKKVGGSTSTTTHYDYSKVWSDELIASSSFKDSAAHANPITMPFQTQSWTADKVTLGGFALSQPLMAKIGGYKPLAIEAEAALPAAVQDKGRVAEGGYYIGADPSAPQIGDLRVRFEIVKPCDISVIAKQVGNTFEAYTTKVGGDILLLESGTHSAQEMIATAQSSNTMLTWILRLVGFVLMFIGFCLFFNPLSVLADVLPILGSIVGAGTAVVAGLLSACLSLLTVSVAWIVYRPILGCLLLAASIAVSILIKSKLKKPATAQ